MNKNYLLIIIPLLLVIIGNNVSHAAVNNSLITVPTADIITGPGAVSGEVFDNYYRLEAVFSLDSRIEVGGEAIIDRDNVNKDEREYGPLVKFPLAVEGKNRPAIAAGLKDEDLYLTFSKNIAYGTGLHLGYGQGQFEGLYLGINKVINPVSIKSDKKTDNKTIPAGSFPPINLMAEYVDEEINLGLRFNVQSKLYFDLGLLDFEDLKAGISYSF